jgi:acetyl-CoA C-acetyltransferase
MGRRLGGVKGGETSMDPERIPVIVGVGQTVNRPKTMEEIREPVDLIESSIRKAAEDGGAEGAIPDVDMLGVVNILSWSYADPPATVAERIGAQPRIRWYTGVGACGPQWLVAEAADKIAQGEVRLALICGAESYASRSTARKCGERPPWKREPGTLDLVGDLRPATTPAEDLHGLIVPSDIYALFENARRHEKRQSLEEHTGEIADLCAEMGRVAAQNPYAWFRQERKAEEFSTISDRNRMVAFPYTKLMCSMIFTDQSAAVLMMSLAEAGRRKIPEEKYVHLVGFGEASDLWYVTHRRNLHDSPCAKAAVDMALAQAGTRIDEVDFLDFYSCFPCVPRIVRDELEIKPSDPRPLTVTGGMSNFGGPGNNYSLHAVCRMAEILREQPETTGLVQSVSWFLSKHAVGIYRSGPRPEAWRRVNTQPFLKPLEALEAPEIAEAPEGEATVETYTVGYPGGRPGYGFVIGRTGDGARFLARVEDDPDTLTALTTEEGIGKKGKVWQSPAGTTLFAL